MGGGVAGKSCEVGFVIIISYDHHIFDHHIHDHNVYDDQGHLGDDQVHVHHGDDQDHDHQYVQANDYPKNLKKLK